MSAEPHSGCADCPAAKSRRAFLRDLGLAVGAVVAANAFAAEALAQSVSEIAPVALVDPELSYQVPASDGVFVDETNDVILARWQGRAYAFSIRCPHKGARLQWRGDEGRVFCPKHKSRFLPDGAHASGRASRDLDRYAMRREGGTLLVNRNVLHRSDQDPEGWRRAVVAL